MRIKGTSNISIIVARNEHAALHKAKKKVLEAERRRGNRSGSQRRAAKRRHQSQQQKQAKAMAGCTFQLLCLEILCSVGEREIEHILSIVFLI